MQWKAARQPSMPRGLKPPMLVANTPNMQDRNAR
jgi:hypothetical protein